MKIGITGRLSVLTESIPLLYHSGLVAGSSIVAAVGSYLFTISVARQLGPAEYGSLGALLALYFLAAISFAPLAGAITKFTAEFIAQGEGGKAAALLVDALKLTAGVTGVVALLVFGLAGSAIARVFHLPAGLPLFLTGALLVSALLFTTTQGALRGLQRFMPLGGLVITEAFARLVFGLLFLALGLQLTGAVAAYVVGSVCAFLLSLVVLRGLLRQRRQRYPKSSLLHFSSRLFLVTIIQAALSNAPILLSKRYLTPLDAGFFVAIAALGNLLIPITQAFSIALFPEVVARHARGEQTSSLLWRVLLFVGGVSFILAATFRFAGDLIVHLTYGTSYGGIVPYLWRYSVAQSLTMLGGAYMSYCMAKHRFHFTGALLATMIIQILLLARFHASIGQFVGALIGSSVLFVGLLLLTDLVVKFVCARRGIVDSPSK